MNTEERLAEADDFWERVYSRIESMLADIDGGRPKLDDLDEMTPEQRRAAHEKADEDEVTYLRECVHDVVREALVVFAGWPAAPRKCVSEGFYGHPSLNSEEPCSGLAPNIVQELQHLGVSVESCTQCAPSSSSPGSCCAERKLTGDAAYADVSDPSCDRVSESPQQDALSANELSTDDGNIPESSRSPSANDRARVGTVYYDEATHEYVMPPDFLGDEELRWQSDPPSCCDEAAKVTDSVSNAAQPRSNAPESDVLTVPDDNHGWHYAAGHWKENGQDWYDVREVYGFGGYTEDCVSPESDTLEGLEEVLRMMLLDIAEYPVVEVDDETA